MYGPMLPLLHTSEEIKLARDSSVSAELFSEGKTNRLQYSSCGYSWYLCDELMHTVPAFGHSTLPRSAWIMTDIAKLVIQDILSSVICGSVMQACLYGSRVISSFVVLQARITAAPKR